MRRPALPAHASVEAHDCAQVWLTGTTVVRDGVHANGVLANDARATTPGNDPCAGPAQVVIRGDSRVQNHDGYGAVATAGGRVTSTDDGATVINNDYGGMYSTGWGSAADIWGNSNVLENLGYGVTAAQNGDASVATPDMYDGAPNTLNSLVELNEGGLRATTGGFVFTGLAGPRLGCAGVYPAAVNENNLSGDDDARATSGSLVTAQCTYWNGRTQASQLDTFADGSSTVAVVPLKPTPNAFAPSTTSARTSGAAAGAKTDGPGGEGPLGVAAAARALAYTGDTEGAGALLGPRC